MSEGCVFRGRKFSEAEIQLIRGITERFKMIRVTKDEPLWDFFVDKYHYLGYHTLIGHFLKYLNYDREKLLGCIGFAEAVLKLNLRDKWIGWSKKTRERIYISSSTMSAFLFFPG